MVSEHFDFHYTLKKFFVVKVTSIISSSHLKFGKQVPIPFFFVVVLYCNIMLVRVSEIFSLYRHFTQYLYAVFVCVCGAEY